MRSTLRYEPTEIPNVVTVTCVCGRRYRLNRWQDTFKVTTSNGRCITHHVDRGEPGDYYSI